MEEKYDVEEDVYKHVNTGLGHAPKETLCHEAYSAAFCKKDCYHFPVYHIGGEYEACKYASINQAFSRI